MSIEMMLSLTEQRCLHKLLNIAQKCGKILVFLMNNHSDLTNDPVAQPGIYHVIHITIIKLVKIFGMEKD